MSLPARINPSRDHGHSRPKRPRSICARLSEAAFRACASSPSVVLSSSSSSGRAAAHASAEGFFLGDFAKIHATTYHTPLWRQWHSDPRRRAFQAHDNVNAACGRLAHVQKTGQWVVCVTGPLLFLVRNLFAREDDSVTLPLVWGACRREVLFGGVSNQVLRRNPCP